MVKDVLDALNISEQMFQETEHVLGNNPQVSELMMMAAAGKLGGLEANGPKLTKQEILKAHESSKELRIQSLKEEFTPSDKSELERLVDTAKMEDRMFFKTGIEDEDFEEAFMFYMKDDMNLQMEMQ